MQPDPQGVKLVRTHTIVFRTNFAKTPMTTTDSFFERLRVFPLAMAEGRNVQPDEQRGCDDAA